MSQGSNMTRSHKGMRKGISLLELLIAIVLLGVLSSVGFKYYKVFFDTSFAAKQAKMYVLIEQGQQLSGAHQLYDTKNGLVPVDINDMVLDKQLLKEPPVMPEVSTSGWKLWTYQTYGLNDNNDSNGTIDLDSSTGGANDIAFVLKFDTVTTAQADRLDFCNIINNTGERTWGLSSNDANYTTIGTTPALMYDSNVTNKDLFCYKASDGNYTAVFTVLVDPT